MAMKPLPTSRAREVAGAAEQGAGRSVGSTKSIESPSEKDGGADKQHGNGRQRSREERELDEQRRALTKLVLGVFEVDLEVPSAAQPPRDAAAPGGAGAPRKLLDPRLEQSILEFMYALFHALDQIDDAEPTLALGLAASGASPPSGRSAFGERIDLLASRIALLPTAAAHPAGTSAAPSLSAGLEVAHLGVLRVIHGDAAVPDEVAHPRLALAALLRRLANAMHVAPTLGYGSSANAGALLRVRA